MLLFLVTTKVCNLSEPCGGCLHERFCTCEESSVAKHHGMLCLICTSSENQKILRRKSKQQLLQQPNLKRLIPQIGTQVLLHQQLTTKHLLLLIGTLSRMLLHQLIGELKSHQLQMLPKIGEQSPCLLAAKLMIGVLNQLVPQTTGVLAMLLQAGIKFSIIA